MASYISLNFLCNVCDGVFPNLTDRAEREGLQLNCELCGAEKSCVETVGMPASPRKSYLDGQRRGGGYQQLKEAAKLDVAKAQLPPDERKKVEREISKLKKL